MAKALETYNPVSNGGEPAILTEAPYVVSFTLEGTSPLLFHAWNNESVEEKGKAKKGSKINKTDDVQSYIYRDEKGFIALPSEYVRMSVVNAARYHQDPRSPRKSAIDLFKAGVAWLEELASLGSKDWDYLDKRRVTVQRSGITRSRPAFRKGWKAEFTFQVLTPEYIEPTFLHEILSQAGRLVGVGDFRPTYGRFQVTRFEVLRQD